MTSSGIKINSLGNLYSVIANMADDTMNGGNGDGEIKGGKEEGLYESACSTISGSTFMFSGKTYNMDGSVFTKAELKNNDQDLLNNILNRFNFSSQEQYVDGSATKGNYTSVSRAGGFSNIFDSKILFYANKWGIAPNLVKAIIKTESGFKQTATSSCKCKGLMQVHPKFNAGNLYDVDTNLDAGCRIYKHALNTFGGDKNKALMAYNMGEGAVKRGKTNGYANKVLSYTNQLNNSSKYSVVA